MLRDGNSDDRYSNDFYPSRTSVAVMKHVYFSDYEGPGPHHQGFNGYNNSSNNNNNSHEIIPHPNDRIPYNYQGKQMVSSSVGTLGRRKSFNNSSIVYGSDDRLAYNINSSSSNPNPNPVSMQLPSYGNQTQASSLDIIPIDHHHHLQYHQYPGTVKRNISTMKNYPEVYHNMRSLNELITIKNDELKRQKIIIRKLYKALDEKDQYLANLENELALNYRKKYQEASEGKMANDQSESNADRKALKIFGQSETPCNGTGGVNAKMTDVASPHEEATLNVKRRIKRLAISGESSQFLLAQNETKNGVKNVYPKSKSIKDLIRKGIANNDLMKHYAPEQVDEIINAIYPIFYEKNSWIIKEEETGSILYVIGNGIVEVSKAGKKIREMTTGQIFGELAILYNCIRTASVRAITDCNLWAIDRQIFQTITMQSGMKRLEEYKNFLKSVPIFNSLSPEILSKVADELYMVRYKQGEYVIREGARGDTFYIISRGQVKVTKNQPNKLEEKFIRTMGPGEWFGEKALIFEDTRTANIIANSANLECLVLDREFYNLLIKDLKSLERKYSDETEKPKNKFNQEMREQYKNLKISDLVYVTTIGVGGFARVELVHLKTNSAKSFALKKLKKQSIIKMRQKEHVINERNILLEVESDFIVRLFRTFKDKYYVYFLMEVCLGGELWTILRYQTSFNDTTTRFYTACVINALEYLHNKGIIYRDLKPENLILDLKGYCKLTDFGFAKRIGFASKTWTFCGTPEYVAPEIILNKGHDFSADIWSLGILMFELLTGLPPFTTNEPMTIYNDILKGISAIQFPDQITRNASNLIKKLCKENPNERLGNGKGIAKVKKHVWFEGFNWVGLAKRTIKPPIMPKVKSAVDASNFDLYEQDAKLPEEEVSGWDKDF